MSKGAPLARKPPRLPAVSPGTPGNRVGGWARAAGRERAGAVALPLGSGGLLRFSRNASRRAGILTHTHHTHTRRATCSCTRSQHPFFFLLPVRLAETLGGKAAGAAAGVCVCVCARAAFHLVSGGSRGKPRCCRRRVRGERSNLASCGGCPGLSLF